MFEVLEAGRDTLSKTQSENRGCRKESHAAAGRPFKVRVVLNIFPRDGDRAAVASKR